MTTPTETKSTSEFANVEFQILGMVPGFLGADVVHIERGTFTEGFCTSQTCAHNSHDAAATGDTVTIICRRVGTLGEWVLYESGSDRLFTYDDKEKGNYNRHLTLNACDTADVREFEPLATMGVDNPGTELISLLTAHCKLVSSPASDGYGKTEFQVLSYPRFLDGDVVRIRRNTFTEGHCLSRTCAHNSHSPAVDGDTITVICRQVGELGDRVLFESYSGHLFTYDDRDCGHFNRAMVLSPVEK